MQSIHRQLADARVKQGLSLAKLKKRAGLSCSVASVSRKLAGKRRLTDREIERLARALGIEVSVKRTVVTFGAGAEAKAAA